MDSILRNTGHKVIFIAIDSFDQIEKRDYWSVFMSEVEFTKFIEVNQIPHVFTYDHTKGGSPLRRDAVFVFRDGVIYSSNRNGFTDWNRYWEIAIKLDEAGFKWKKHYDNARAIHEKAKQSDPSLPFFKDEVEYLLFNGNQWSDLKLFRAGYAAGFLRGDEYENAIRYGCDSKAIYDEFMASKFRISGVSPEIQYLNFLRARKGSFLTLPELQAAESLGIPDREEWTKFTSFCEKYKGIHYYINLLQLNTPIPENIVGAYDSYKKWLESGFSDVAEFANASKTGFFTKTEYDAFKASGCKTKEEYEILTQKSPKIFIEFDARIEQTKKDLDDAVKNKRNEDIVRLNCVIFEKRLALLYTKTFKKELPKDKDILDILSELEQKLGKIVDDEFHYWRRLRNAIIRDNEKVDEGIGNKARLYFNELNKKLEALLTASN
nr:hypothetical protein [Candidatus Sigynarchaeota archaeon]